MSHSALTMVHMHTNIETQRIYHPVMHLCIYQHHGSHMAVGVCISMFSCPKKNEHPNSTCHENPWDSQK